MKIATWNINSLRVRLSQVLDWLQTEQPDVLCLQETKLQNHHFPCAELQALGYQAVYHGQKSYNGVATLTRQPATEITTLLPGYDSEDARLISVTVGDVRVVNVYVPNGQSVSSEKYQGKLKWLAALTLYLQAELAKYTRVVVVGDFNIAPKDEDVHDPAAWVGHVLVSPAERAAFFRLLDLGFIDTFRTIPNQPEKSYSWWDYRAASFRRNLGLRIDLILASTDLAKQCQHVWIDKLPRANERPSDHTPVIATFE